MRRVLPALLLSLAGRGTVVDPAEGQVRAFGGARTDRDYGVNGDLGCRVSVLAPFFVLDLPLSAAADVALLPFTIPAELFAPKPVNLK